MMLLKFTCTFISHILFLSVVGIVICWPSSQFLLSQQTNKQMEKRLIVEHEEKDAAVLHTLDDSSHCHCDLYLSSSPLFPPIPSSSFLLSAQLFSPGGCVTLPVHFPDLCCSTDLHLPAKKKEKKINNFLLLLLPLVFLFI